MKPRSLKSVELLLLMLFVSIVALPSANGQLYPTISYTDPDEFATDLSDLGIPITTIDLEGIAEAGEDPYILEGSEFLDCYGVTMSGIVGIPSVGIPSETFWNQFTPTSGVACLAPNVTATPIGVITVNFSSPVRAIGAYFLDSDKSLDYHPTSGISAAGANVPVTGTDVEPKFVGIIDQDGFTSATFYIGLRWNGSFWRSDPEGGTAIDDLIFEQIVEPCVIPVEIDIKPGSTPNTINLGSNGVVPVAILSSETFDATQVDPETVILAGAGVAVRGKGTNYLTIEKDVNGDGLTDLEVKVETENLDPGEIQDGWVKLTGITSDGQEIEGWDEITIVPPE